VSPTVSATPTVSPTVSATPTVSPTPTPTYDLTVDQRTSCCNVSVVGYGTVPGGTQNTFNDIPEDTVINVNASFNASCNTWNGWTGGVANASAMSTTVTMTSDKTITANCTCVRSLTVNQTASCCNVSVVGYGTVPGGTSNTFYNISCGTVIQVNASFNASCNTWNNWTGGVANASAMNTTVTMSSNQSITANCTCVRSLTVDQTASCCNVSVVGYGTVPGGTQNTWNNIMCGTVIQVNASFNGTCNTWNNWIGSVANASAMNTTVTMDANKSITANCSYVPPVTYNLTVNQTTSDCDVAVAGYGTVTAGNTNTWFGISSGTIINVNASFSANCGFWQNWTGSVANASAMNTTVTMDATKTITANGKKAITYDRSNMGLIRAYEKNAQFTGPTDVGGGEALAADYTAIANSDDSRWDTSLATGDRNWNAQLYKFNITNPANVQWIQVAWEGYGEHEAEHPTQLRIYNYTASAWEMLDRQYSQSASIDVVLGNRRYELPNVSVSNYAQSNASSGGYDVTVTAEGNTHGSVRINTDYVKVTAYACQRPVPTFTVDGRKGNFYLWQTYYYRSATWWKRTFSLEVIDRVKESVGFSSGAAEPNNTNNLVTNTTHAMWMLQSWSPWVNAARMRAVQAPIVGETNNTMCDGEFWFLPNSDVTSAKANQHVAVVGAIMANGVSPAMVSDYPTSGGGWDAANATMDAPYTVGDNFVMYERQDADSNGGGDQWITCTIRYNVTMNQTNWNVSNYSTNLNGSGKFGSENDGTQLFNVNLVQGTWITPPANYNGNATAQSFCYYNDTVENWVRKFDPMRYWGYEDWAIKAYESENFGRENLTVSQRGGGQNMDVSITINNTTGVAQKFNTLLCVFNLSKNTWGQGNNIETLNGWCVYPNVTTPGGSWPYLNSIQTTNTLNPGDKQTITWTDVQTLTAGNDYWLWCSGMVYGPWNAR